MFCVLKMIACEKENHLLRDTQQLLIVESQIMTTLETRIILDATEKFRIRKLAGGSQDIHELATAGLVNQLAIVLKADQARVDEVSHDNKTLLMCAIIDKKFEVVALLLSLGADVNIKNHSKGNTTLHYTCMDNNLEISLQLIKHGADIFIKNSKGQTAFQLVKDINKRKILNDSTNILQMAANGNKVDLDNMLHISPSRLFECDLHTGNNLLLISSQNGHNEVVSSLLMAGLDINSINFVFQTSLVLACKYNKESTVRLLLEKGADILVVTANLDTCLHI